MQVHRNRILLSLISAICVFGVGCASVTKIDTADETVTVSKVAEKIPGTLTEEAVNTSNDKPADEEKMTKQEATSVSDLPALHVDGTQLVDNAGNPVQLKGLSTHGLSWFPQYVNQELFTQLADEWNTNVVRLAMYSAEYNGYCTGGNQEALKQLIRDGVQYAKEAGMYVIVDWHVLGEGDPNLYKEESKKFFDEMSKEFSEEQHVIYEICNEPNGGVNWTSVKEYALEVIPVIRANDEDAVIIVGTPTWSQDVDRAASDPITEYDNIMYALHFYAATHKDDLRNRMVNAIEDGLPIIVSEYGICSADGNGGIDAAQAQAWIDLMDEKGISYVAWNLSNKAETSAVFSSNCNKTYGFTTEDLSEGGLWIYNMLTASDESGIRTERITEESKSETQNAETQKTVTSEEAQPQEETEVSAKEAGNGLQYTTTVIGSWESNHKKYEQYAVTLSNISDKELTSWKVEIAFDKNITLSDGWNGNYTVKENVLEITNMDYNGVIAPEGEVADIGFIICFDN